MNDLVGLLGAGNIDIKAGIDQLAHFYPAFGGVASKQIKDLIILQDGELKAVDATWWFDCQELYGDLVVGKRTTFNARNLDSPYWKGAVRHHRGIAIATGIGESLQRDGKKHQFLMEAERPILLGCVYRSFPGMSMTDSANTTIKRFRSCCPTRNNSSIYGSATSARIIPRSRIC